ncbi:MAG: hypothetical protein JW741_29100 [Sedimentisphaerales bacterium]|nr:hypothetical protein [Sedimentisphaerales bacterium]
MDAKRRLLLTAVLGVFLAGGCRDMIRAPGSRNAIVLKPAGGVATTEFRLADTIQFSAARLTPRTGYNVRVVRDDGQVVRELRLSTDPSGRIPETILWHDVGVTRLAREQRPDRAYVSHLPDWAFTESQFANRQYTLQVIRNGQIVRQAGFSVADWLARPRLYAADAQGYPTSGFIIGEEHVWAVGKNFPAGSVVRLWAVDNRNDWRDGDSLEDVTKQYYGERPILFELRADQTCFKKRLWPKHLTSIGSYDIVAEVVTYPWGRYQTQSAEVQNIVSSLSYSGFVVQRRPGEAEPLEMDLAGTRQSPLTYKETFLTTENVYVGVDPTVQPSYIGQTADIYIVDDKPDAQWLAGTTLQDKTGFVEQVTIYGVCGNCWATLAWAAPLTAGEYDVVLDFNQNGQYDPGIDLIDSLDPVGFTVSEIRVDSISFNYAGSGAVTIYDNFAGSNVTAPEYFATATSPIKPAAWVRGGSHSVQVNFKAVSGVGSAQIWAEDGLGGLHSSGSPVPVSFSGGQGQATFSVNTVPNAVGKHEFHWDWKYRVGSTTHPMGRTGRHLLYTVLDTPVASLSPPWLEILDYACTWAGGATTREQVCTDMLNNGFKNHYTWDMDCHRLASDFVRLVGTQGVVGSQHRWASLGHWGALDDMAYQKTKAVDPVGPTWGYGQIEWSWHQWAEAEGAQRDAAAAVTLPGNWGDYEDSLFAQYKRTTDTSPYQYTWENNQPGQILGCEHPNHRSYTNSPPLYSWRRPDR